MQNSQTQFTKISLLAADIEKLDRMIANYKEGSDASAQFMVEQYQFRRENLYNSLCTELISLPAEDCLPFLQLLQNISTLNKQTKKPSDM